MKELIEAKAMELYPDHIIRSKNPAEIPTKVRDQRVEAYLKGHEDTIAELSAPKEAEEVLKQFAIYQKHVDNDRVAEMVKFTDALKAMQEWGIQERAKGIEQGIEQYQRELREELQKIGKLHFSITDKEKEQYKEQIQSLQQQLDTSNTTIYTQRGEITKLTGEIRQHKAEMKQLEEDCAEINADKAKAFLKETDKLQQQLSMKEDDHAHTVLELKKQLSDCGETRKELKEQCDAYFDKLSEKDESIEKWRQVNRGNIGLISRMEAENQQLKEQIKRLQS